MSDPPAPRPFSFKHATGKFPAWVWRAVSSAGHDARHNGIPIVVAREGDRTLMIVDRDDWRDLSTPPPEMPSDLDDDWSFLRTP